MLICGARIGPAPMSALPPERAPATMAPTPSSMAMIDCVCASRELLAQAQQMSAGKVAGFVGEHADDFVRRLGFEQRAGVDEDMAAVHDEGIEAAVVEHDRRGCSACARPGGVQDRRRIVAQQLLDLGVADDRQATRRPLLRLRPVRALGPPPAAARATAVRTARPRIAGFARRAVVAVPVSIMPLCRQPTA